jgi:PadR family transcriptional regulator
MPSSWPDSRLNRMPEARVQPVATMSYMVVGSSTNLMSQMRRGAIEYCVLALLQGRDMYGFELTRALSTAGGLVASEGTVYPLLSRLRNDGLVETFWEPSPQGPPRRYYRLTHDGRAALAAFIDQWRQFRDTVDTILRGGHQ